MASYTETTNYKLKKGSGGTAQSIEQQRVYDNENADTIDSTMKTISNAANAAQSDADTAQATANTAQGEVDALEIVVATKESIVNVSANRSSTLKSISTLDTPSTDYLAHLYTVTGYAQNQAMPNNADGKALWSIKGLTAENLVTNGDFSNGTTGWSPSISTLSMSGQNLAVTANGATPNGAVAANTPYAKSGIRYYCCCYARVTSASCVGIKLWLRGEQLLKNISNPLANQLYLLSGVAVCSADNPYTVLVEHSYADAATANGKVMEIMGGSNGVRAYNLDSIFGSTIAATLTAADCDKIFENYIDGARSTLAGLRLTSTLSTTHVSTAYTPQGLLRSVPSASDEVYSDADGRTWKVQRVSDDYALLMGDITELTTSGANRDFVQTKAITGGTARYTSSVNLNIAVNNFTSIRTDSPSYWDIASPLNTFGCADSGYVYIFFPKGTYANLAAAQAALAGTIIRYELATPIVTELETIGNLTAYPNGSILAEPCYSGYTTGTTTVVGTAELPIKGINKVESISLDSNGNAVRTDVTASCSVDTTTLTITGYDAAKVYFYDLDIDTKYTTTGLKTYQVECPTAVVTHDFTAGATAWTLTANENKATYFTPTNAGGTANIIAEPKNGKLTVWKNTSGQTLTVKTASSTGVTIATAKTATLMYTGTDFIKVAEV